jgi:type I restriction enzyme S subunit
MELIPGFKRSDVGMIPEDWDAKPLGEIGDSLIGLTYRPSDVRKYGTLVLRSSNVQNGTLCFDDNVFVETEIPERIMVRPGDILVCVRNGSRDLIGKSALIDERAIGMTFGAFMGVFRSEYGKFLHHVFQSGIFKKQINEHLGATINQITNKSLNSFKVPLPPTNEERSEIAKALSDVDELLATLDQMIVKKRDLKQATMQQLLTGKTRLPGFSGEWEVKRLGDVAEIVMGQSPSSSNYNSIGNGLPLIQGNADIVNRWAIKRSHTTQITKRGKAGDILMTVRAPVGEVSRTSFDVCLGRGVCAIRFPNDFLYHGLVFFEPNWAKHSKGSTFDSVNSADVNAVEIYLPLEEAEQVAIATILSDIDAELANLEVRRDKTRNIKQAMMHELLKGKTRLIAKEESHV